MKKINGVLRILAFVGIGTFSIAALMYFAGARINTTKSIPIGLYWNTSKAVGKGEYVMFCPPQRAEFADAKARHYITAGYCPGNYGYMMKKILAAKGDVVAANDQGVYVNGEMVPHSTPLPSDGAGQALPQYRAEAYTLKENELLLMSDASATSFDARYFGLVSKAQVKSVIQPVITF